MGQKETKGDKSWGRLKGREQNRYTSTMQVPLERHQGGQRVIRQQMFYHKDSRGEKSNYMLRWHSSACTHGFENKTK